MKLGRVQKFEKDERNRVAVACRLPALYLYWEPQPWPRQHHVKLAQTLICISENGSRRRRQTLENTIAITD